MGYSLKNKVVTIRKKHQCFSCFRMLQPGAKMNYWVGTYEGDFNSLYTCMTCVEIMNMRQDPDEDGFPEGYVYEMLENNETPEEFLLRISE